MGCGVSKLDPEEQGPNCSQRRIEETARQNRNEPAILDSPEPVGEGRDEEVDFSVNHGRKSVSSSVGKIGFVKEGGMEEEENVEKLCGDEKERGEGRKELEKEEVGVGVVKGVDGGNEESEEHGKTDEEEGEYFDREDFLIFPRSPSFREYCIFPLESDVSSKDDGNGDGATRENMSKSKDSFAPLNSSKGSTTTQLPKKWGKGSGFGRVLSKSLNVTTCYYSVYSTSPDGPRKLAGKATG